MVRGWERSTSSPASAFLVMPSTDWTQLETESKGAKEMQSVEFIPLGHSSSGKVTWDLNTFDQTIAHPPIPIIKDQLDGLSVYFSKDWALYLSPLVFFINATLEIYSEHLSTGQKYWAWEENSLHYDLSWQSHPHCCLRITLIDLITKFLSSAILYFLSLCLWKCFSQWNNLMICYLSSF